MRYTALASDYDGTIAEDGLVSASTLISLRRFREAGGTLILNTGREVQDLQSIFPELPVFHWIVAENGAVLYNVETGAETLLAPAPEAALLASLQRRRVAPLYIGKVIVATYEHHADEIEKAIEETGADRQVILNKGSLMVLPNGCDKASGLRELYKVTAIKREVTVGVGDGENDLALLEAAGLGVALANALPLLKDKAAWVMSKPAGAGVSELIERLLAL